MTPYVHVLHVKPEVFLITAGVPAAGLIVSMILRRLARRRVTDDLSGNAVLGFRLIAYAFAAYLIWLALTIKADPHVTSFIALVLFFLTFAAIIAALSGLVLLFLHSRRALRISGTALALLALAYAVVSGLALLSGGVA